VSDEPLPLDDYEAVNLLWLLRVASAIGLDTGDWLMQLTYKLEARGHESVREPNASPATTASRLQHAAKRIVEASR